MTIFHLNPETGNPNICRATKKPCPYAQIGEPHFNSKEDARAYFETTMENPISRGAELILRTSRIQKEILEKFEKTGWNNDLKKSIDIRNNLDAAIQNLDISDDFHGDLPTVAQMPTLELSEPIADSSGVINYTGISNRFEPGEISPQTKATLEKLSEVSAQWVRSLSNAEILSVVNFSHSSESYVFYSDPDFQTALEKVADFETPVSLYSGMSAPIAQMLKNVQVGEKIDLNRGFSTSLNPGQINAFSAPVDNKEAIIIEAKRGAVLQSISTNPHELEVVLAAGEYEVVSIEGKANFRYNSETDGIDYERVIHLRQV